MGSYMYPPCEFLTHNHHLLPLIPILSLSQACPALWKSNSHISRHVDVKNANMNSWALEWSCPWSEKDDTSPKAVMTKHDITMCILYIDANTASIMMNTSWLMDYLMLSDVTVPDRMWSASGMATSQGYESTTHLKWNRSPAHIY